MKTIALGATLCAVEVGLCLWKRAQGKSFKLDFKDAEPELMATLGLGSV